MPEDAAFQAEDWNEEELIEQWANEGDEDAALVMEYEQSMLDAIQDDADLALSSTTYAEARKRLADRVKNRGFWPSSGAKGKSRGKGWEKGKRVTRGVETRETERLSNRGSYRELTSPLRPPWTLESRMPRSRTIVRGQYGHGSHASDLGGRD